MTKEIRVKRLKKALKNSWDGLIYLIKQVLSMIKICFTKTYGEMSYLCGQLSSVSCENLLKGIVRVEDNEFYESPIKTPDKLLKMEIKNTIFHFASNSTCWLVFNLILIGFTFDYPAALRTQQKEDIFRTDTPVKR